MACKQFSGKISNVEKKVNAYMIKTFNLQRPQVWLLHSNFFFAVRVFVIVFVAIFSNDFSHLQFRSANPSQHTKFSYIRLKMLVYLLYGMLYTFYCSKSQKLSIDAKWLYELTKKMSMDDKSKRKKNHCIKPYMLRTIMWFAYCWLTLPQNTQD